MKMSVRLRPFPATSLRAHAFRVTFWFPVAMLIMAGSFGLWRAGIFSNAAFTAGLAAMVIVLLGTTTLAGNGFWAADGGYAKFFPTIVMLVWITVVSASLSCRSASTASARTHAAIPAT
jgi:hypothetical protein